MAQRPWSSRSVARNLPVPPDSAIGCWRCGDTQVGRLPSHRLLRNGVLIGIVPLCRACVAAVPRLDPDPLTVAG